LASSVIANVRPQVPSGSPRSKKFFQSSKMLGN
jgi:hypothetical protein